MIVRETKECVSSVKSTVKLDSVSKVMCESSQLARELPLGAKKNRPFRCVWCDSLQHRKFSCPELSELLRARKLRYDKLNRIVDATTGVECPPLLGRGGMKKLWHARMSTVTRNGTVTVGAFAQPNEAHLLKQGRRASDNHVFVC